LSPTGQLHCRRTITGATLYAFAVGNVVSILNQLDGGRSEFRKNQSAITSYLSLNGVDSDVITRVRRFNDYQWSRTRGFVAGVLFDQLPTDLRTEVTYSMLRDTVQQVPLFTAAPAPLQKRLLQLLQPRTYPPGTALLHPYEQGNEIMFITKGEAEIESDEPVPQEIQYLTSGDYIGDLSFFLNERRNCGAMARSYVDALVLSRSVLERLRQEEPDMKMVLQAMAQKQSQRNQALLLAGLVL
jgi:potassium voltage-gated channel Eag-related subfamily H protein 7